MNNIALLLWPINVSPSAPALSLSLLLTLSLVQIVLFCCSLYFFYIYITLMHSLILSFCHCSHRFVMLYGIQNLAIYPTFHLVPQQNWQPSYTKSRFFLLVISHACVVRILCCRVSLLSQINILFWSQLVKGTYLFFFKKENCFLKSRTLNTFSASHL